MNTLRVILGVLGALLVIVVILLQIRREDRQGNQDRVYLAGMTKGMKWFFWIGITLFVVAMALE